MQVSSYRPLLEVAVLSLVAFVIHKTVFYIFPSESENTFRYSIAILYLIFSIFSFVIITILVQVRRKNIDSVGNTFMLLTCLKMVAAYVLLHPILYSELDVRIEKVNFFLVFVAFLLIETIVTARILNK